MERFTFMALVKSVGTKQKGDGKETEVRILILSPTAGQAVSDIARLVGKAVNVTIEGSQRGLGEA